MITHSYCKGDKLVPDTYNQPSAMPCGFADPWNLTMEVLRFSDGPDLSLLNPEVSAIDEFVPFLRVELEPAE